MRNCHLIKLKFVQLLPHFSAQLGRKYSFQQPLKHKRAGKALCTPSPHRQMGKRPGQLFITSVDWKMQGINEWIKAQKTELSSCISGFSPAEFPPSPEVLLGALGWGRALLVERGWLQLLSVLTLFIMAAPSVAPTLCQAFPSPCWVSWGDDMCAQHSNFSSQWLCTWLWHQSLPWGQAWQMLGEKKNKKTTLPRPSPTHPATDRGKTEASPKQSGGEGAS